MSRLRAAGSAIERGVTAISRSFAWLFAALMLVILINVALRYLFDRPLTALLELQWHLYAFTAMIGLSYALVTDAHVRVDLLYVRFPAVARKIIETLSLVILLLPLCVFLVVEGWEFSATAWRLQEKSALPGGLPMRGLVKGMIPAGAFLLMIAALTRCMRIWSTPESSEAA